MTNLILKLRKLNNVSQEELARVIGVSRPTLIAMEKEKRGITLEELKKMSKLFDIPVEVIIDEELTIDQKLEFSGNTKKSFEKFRNLVLQCVKYGADSDGRITKTKLAKLVYLCDFASYYENLNPISGFSYYKLKQGPVAVQFFDLIDNDESVSVKINGRSMMVSLNEQPSVDVLSADEEQIVKSVCSKWKGKNTNDIVDFTHEQIPWKICRDGEIIPYSLINSESPENVY